MKSCITSGPFFLFSPNNLVMSLRKKHLSLWKKINKGQRANLSAKEMILLDFMLHIQVHIGMDQSVPHPGMYYEFIFEML